MSAFSLIGNNSGIFFYTSDGTNVQAFPNIDSNKASFYALLKNAFTQATDGSYQGTFGAYVNTSIAFVAGTTENESLATLLSGATEVTDALQYNAWTQELSVTSTSLIWTRENSLNYIRVNGGGDINTLTVSGAQDGDVVTLTTLSTPVLVSTGGNLSIVTSFTIVPNSSITFQFVADGATWVELFRSVVPLTTATTVVVAASGLTKSLDPTIDARYQIFTGTGVLLGNSAISSTTAPDGFQWYIDYRCTFSGTSTFSVFGITMTVEQTLNGNSLFLATYDTTLADYRVEQVLNFEGLLGTNIITDANILSLSGSKITGTIPSGTLPPITPSQIAVPSASLVLGNGSNVGAAVALTGDASITNAGVITVPQKTVAFADGTGLAAATPEFVGQVAVQKPQ